jgi:arsenate reductase
MAEAWLRSLTGGRWEVASAGTEARGVHPLAVRAMAEVGIDISGQRSKTLEGLLDRDWDDVITVCDAASESCPVFPRAVRRRHWSFPDPSAVAGAEEECLAAFRRVRDAIRERLVGWLREQNVRPG